MKSSIQTVFQRLFAVALTAFAVVWFAGLGQSAQAQGVDRNGLGVFALSKSYYGKSTGSGGASYSGSATGGGVSYQFDLSSPNIKMMPFVYSVAGNLDVQVNNDTLKATDYKALGAGAEFRYMGDAGGYIGVSVASVNYSYTANYDPATTNQVGVIITQVKAKGSEMLTGVSVGWEGEGFNIGLNNDLQGQSGMGNFGGVIGWRF